MPLPKNIDAIVHIGAGQCEELATYLASSANEIVLIEPSPQLAAELRLRCENEPRVSVLEVAVSNNSADRQLSEYNLAGANSLYAPTGLKKLFPGLRLLRLQSVTTITADELLKQCGLNGDQNALVIQAPGAELGIVESLTESGGIDQFSYLSVTCAETPLYATPSESATVLKALQEQGFDLAHQDQSDPDWPIWTLHYNELKQKLANLTVKYQNISEQLKQAQKELSEEQEKRKKLSAELSKLKEKIATYQDELSNASGQARPSYTVNDFESLERRLEYFFNQHTLQLEQAANALGRHVTSTVTGTAIELEAGIALQQLFGRDLPSLEDQSHRLPSIVALKLSRRLKSQPYDVILEMGSGVTTTLMAHTIKNVSRNEDKESSKQTEFARYADPSEDDLPKRIVCFEHNRSKYNELTKSLKRSGLAPVVSLEFAPLVPYNHNGEEHLFYDCGNRLRNIAELLEGRQARIFILVNRVNGDSRPEPLVALPLVLQYLSGHTLDIVVHAQGQTDLSQHWQALLEHRGLEYQAITEYGDKYIQRVTVNP